MSEENVCEACAGTGFKLHSRRDLMVTFDMGTNCPECDGTGELERTPMTNDAERVSDIVRAALRSTP